MIGPGVKTCHADSQPRLLGLLSLTITAESIAATVCSPQSEVCAHTLLLAGARSSWQQVLPLMEAAHHSGW